MKTNTLKNILICFFFSLILSNCKKLDIENLNNPDKGRTLSTTSDIKAVQSGAFQQLYTMFLDYSGGPHLEWTGDYITMTNNFRSMWSMFKVEPRPTFDNSLNFTDQSVTLTPWQNLNAAISSSNDVIREIELNGKKIIETVNDKPVDNTQMILTSAYFCKAMAQGYIANIFDKGYIVNYYTDVSNIKDSPIPLVDHKQMLQESLRNFDICISLCQKNSFTMDESFLNNLKYTNSELEALCNSQAAHFIVQNARNSAENAATDWQRVRSYAASGITQDYSIAQNGATFSNAFAILCGNYWYWRMDLRIIRLMDPSYPKRFPLSGSAILPPAKSIDNRLNLYYNYESNMSFFRLDRGPQLRSNYRIRYPQYELLYYGGGIGPMTYMFSYENQLMLAEAAAMTGNLPEAIGILNSGANNRSSIGLLPDLPNSASKEEVLNAIFYERDIDLMLSNYAIHFNDMRRRDMLQKGTILHFPVPSQELSITGIAEYTYGGERNADGINTADGSNSWLK